MTEEEWLESKDTDAMLQFLETRRGVSKRKLRLFACDCARRIHGHHGDKRCERYVERVERVADGSLPSSILRYGARLTRELGIVDGGTIQGCKLPAMKAAVATGSPSAVWAARTTIQCVWQVAMWEGNFAEANGSILATVRCAFGNPFRPAPLDPTWLTWNGGVIRKLAEAIYDERAFDRLPILADALEDVGCTDAAILDHLRGPGPHVRGCWVLDLLLGKK